MRKIPTLFRRDPEDRKHVLPEINPGCEWVLAGEGVATRKYDGTCLRFDGTRWWARREVRPGKAVPPNYLPIETDPATGKTVGWEPIEQSAFVKFWHEALESEPHSEGLEPGTYELIGPKINGNPEASPAHRLVAHATAETLHPSALTYEGLRDTVLALSKQDGIEGFVWHHPDGRMAKLKGRDFA
jgi:hypothetical protein